MFSTVPQYRGGVQKGSKEEGNAALLLPACLAQSLSPVNCSHGQTRPLHTTPQSGGAAVLVGLAASRCCLSQLPSLPVLSLQMHLKGEKPVWALVSFELAMPSLAVLGSSSGLPSGVTLEGVRGRKLFFPSPLPPFLPHPWKLRMFQKAVQRLRDSIQGLPQKTEGKV